MFVKLQLFGSEGLPYNNVGTFCLALLVCFFIPSDSCDATPFHSKIPHKRFILWLYSYRMT